MPAKQQPRSEQWKEFEDLQGRLDASEVREAQCEDMPAAVKAELEDASTTTDARAALKSEFKHKHAALEEECKRTTELEPKV